MGEGDEDLLYGGGGGGRGGQPLKEGPTVSVIRIAFNNGEIISIPNHNISRNFVNNFP